MRSVLLTVLLGKGSARSFQAWVALVSSERSAAADLLERCVHWERSQLLNTE